MLTTFFLTAIVAITGIQMISHEKIFVSYITKPRRIDTLREPMNEQTEP